MQRRKFIQNTAMAGGLTMINPTGIFANTVCQKFPTVRVPEGARNFESKAIEKAIKKFSKNVSDEELTWLFNNCFPNTLDTTVTYSTYKGAPDTYVITGDIDAMWYIA